MRKGFHSSLLRWIWGLKLSYMSKREKTPAILDDFGAGRDAMEDHMIRVGAVAALLLLVGAHHWFTGPALGAGPDPAPPSDLRQIKKFVSVEVQTQGTAEKLGLSGDELSDLT